MSDDPNPQTKPPLMSVSQHDWSLHRKGPQDQQRHKERIKEAIKQDLKHIVSEENIILSDGKHVIKVPIRSLEEYRFRYDDNSGKHAGAGDGNSQVGDVLGKGGNSKGQGQGPGKGQGPAGEQPGVDYYEAEVSVDEIAALLFEDLGLPNLQEKRLQEIESPAVRFTDIRKKGAMSNLDKRRTLLENLKRNASAGNPSVGNIRNEDLRYKTWETRVEYQSNAVILAMMDVSGSMGEFEKYIARSFYFWMVRFLRTKYENVRIVFISHHTEAKEVTEEEFFHKGESGGTQVSSAYQLALNIIRERFPSRDWNIYPFHFSDGDNLPWDNDLCVRLVKEMLAECNLFGYGEIREGYRGSTSTLMSAFNKVDDPKFISVTINDKAAVYPALQRFFSKSPVREIATT
ncbi:MAG: sporulation protein YhbH [Chloroflexota bacterium]|nr:sporulation protein YhbH [Chloroflexota bacterium]MDQ5864856.1 sporulation protein YhbH [Chloroflexota bacterium]